MNRTMSKIEYNLMKLEFSLTDFINPYVTKRIEKFNITQGMKVVDYGCGPGRYTIRIAQLVGKTGEVYAVDINKYAINDVKKKIRKYNLKNIKTFNAINFDCGIATGVADCIIAIDMFFEIKEPKYFFNELKRICKKDAKLIIDGGHISLDETKKRIKDVNIWNIEEEEKDFLICRIRS